MTREEETNQRIKKIAGSQVKAGDEAFAIQQAQSEVAGINSQLRNNLELERARFQSTRKNNQMVQQAAGVLMTPTRPSVAQPQQLQRQAGGMNPQTQQILSKYGVNPKKPVDKRTQSSHGSQQRTVAAGVGTTNVRTENTTNNTTTTRNEIKIIQPQIPISQPQIPMRGRSSGGGDDGGASKFKVWLNGMYAKQQAEAEAEKKEFRRREWTLTRSAKAMMERIKSTSRDFATRLDPRTAGASLGSQLKWVLFGFGLFLLKKYWSPLMDRINDFEIMVKTAFGIPIDENLKSAGRKGYDFISKIKAFLGVDEKTTLIGGFGKVITQGVDKLIAKFEIFWKDRVDAVKAIQPPSMGDIGGIDLGPLSGLFSGITGTLRDGVSYLGEIFGAMVGGSKGAVKGISHKIHREGLQALKKGSRGNGFGESNIDTFGHVKSDSSSTYLASQGIERALNDTSGTLRTGEISAGMSDLAKVAKDEGSVTISKSLLSSLGLGKYYSILKNRGDLKEVKMREIKVSRDESDFENSAAYEWGGNIGAVVGGLVGPGIPGMKGLKAYKAAKAAGKAIKAGKVAKGVTKGAFNIGLGSGFGEWLGHGVSRIGGLGYKTKLVPYDSPEMGDDGRPGQVVTAYQLTSKGMDYLGKAAELGEFSMEDQKFNRGIDRLARAAKARNRVIGNFEVDQKDNYNSLSDMMHRSELVDQQYVALDHDKRFEAYNTTAGNITGAINNFRSRLGGALISAGTNSWGAGWNFMVGKQRLNVGQAVNALRGNAHGSSTGYCARAVRHALEAGGFNTVNHPGDANGYLQYLPSQGWTEIDPRTPPQPGDISIIPAQGRHKYGHISMYDGDGHWISDFNQGNNPNVYRDVSPDTIRFFRFGNITGDAVAAFKGGTDVVSQKADSEGYYLDRSSYSSGGGGGGSLTTVWKSLTGGLQGNYKPGTGAMEKKAAFINDMLPVYQKVLEEKGIDPRFAINILGKNAEESGWGESRWAKEYNNYGGITNGDGRTPLKFKSKEDFARYEVGLLNDDYDAFGKGLGGFSDQLVNGNKGHVYNSENPAYRDSIEKRTIDVAYVMDKVKGAGNNLLVKAGEAILPGSQGGDLWTTSDEISERIKRIQERSYGAKRDELGRTFLDLGGGKRAYLRETAVGSRISDNDIEAVLRYGKDGRVREFKGQERDQEVERATRVSLSNMIELDQSNPQEAVKDKQGKPVVCRIFSREFIKEWNLHKSLYDYFKKKQEIEFGVTLTSAYRWHEIRILNMPQLEKVITDVIIGDTYIDLKGYEGTEVEAAFGTKEKVGSIKKLGNLLYSINGFKNKITGKTTNWNPFFEYLGMKGLPSDAKKKIDTTIALLEQSKVPQFTMVNTAGGFDFLMEAHAGAAANTEKYKLNTDVLKEKLGVEDLSKGTLEKRFNSNPDDFWVDEKTGVVRDTVTQVAIGELKDGTFTAYSEKDLKKKALGERSQFENYRSEMEHQMKGEDPITLGDFIQLQNEVTQNAGHEVFSTDAYKKWAAGRGRDEMVWKTSTPEGILGAVEGSPDNKPELQWVIDKNTGKIVGLNELVFEGKGKNRTIYKTPVDLSTPEAIESYMKKLEGKRVNFDRKKFKDLLDQVQGDLDKDWSGDTDGRKITNHEVYRAGRNARQDYAFENNDTLKEKLRKAQEQFAAHPNEEMVDDQGVVYTEDGIPIGTYINGQFIPGDYQDIQRGVVGNLNNQDLLLRKLGAFQGENGEWYVRGTYGKNSIDFKLDPNKIKHMDQNTKIEDLLARGSDTGSSYTTSAGTVVTSGQVTNGLVSSTGTLFNTDEVEFGTSNEITNLLRSYAGETGFRIVDKDYDNDWSAAEGAGNYLSMLSDYAKSMMSNEEVRRAEEAVDKAIQAEMAHDISEMAQAAGDGYIRTKDFDEKEAKAEAAIRTLNRMLQSDGVDESNPVALKKIYDYLEQTHGKDAAEIAIAQSGWLKKHHEALYDSEAGKLSKKDLVSQGKPKFIKWVNNGAPFGELITDPVLSRYVGDFYGDPMYARKIALEYKESKGDRWSEDYAKGTNSELSQKLRKNKGISSTTLLDGVNSGKSNSDYRQDFINFINGGEETEGLSEWTSKYYGMTPAEAKKFAAANFTKEGWQAEYLKGNSIYSKALKTKNASLLKEKKSTPKPTAEPAASSGNKGTTVKPKSTEKTSSNPKSSSAVTNAAKDTKKSQEEQLKAQQGTESNTNDMKSKMESLVKITTNSNSVLIGNMTALNQNVTNVGNAVLEQLAFGKENMNPDFHLYTPNVTPYNLK